MSLVDMKDSELARLTGLTRQGVVQITSGATRSPKGSNVVAIARVFGATTDALLRDGYALPDDAEVVAHVEQVRARYDAASSAQPEAGAA